MGSNTTEGIKSWYRNSYCRDSKTHVTVVEWTINPNIGGYCDEPRPNFTKSDE